MAVKKYKWIKESKPAKFTGVVRLVEYSSQNLHKTNLDLIAPQTETESPAEPGPSALDHWKLGGERRRGRGMYGTFWRWTETRRGGVAEKYRALHPWEGLQRLR
jgi:hypothetical protein